MLSAATVSYFERQDELKEGSVGGARPTRNLTSAG
jgi:hypothetical protein